MSFSLWTNGPGEFRCRRTGLVLVLSQGAEVQFEIDQWDDTLLKPAGLRPAGPLYNIKCSGDALCQLHLPHCEAEDGELLFSYLKVETRDT